MHAKMSESGSIDDLPLIWHSSKRVYRAIAILEGSRSPTILPSLAYVRFFFCTGRAIARFLSVEARYLVPALI